MIEHFSNFVLEMAPTPLQLHLQKATIKTHQLQLFFFCDDVFSKLRRVGWLVLLVGNGQKPADNDLNTRKRNSPPTTKYQITEEIV